MPFMLFIPVMPPSAKLTILNDSPGLNFPSSVASWFAFMPATFAWVNPRLSKAFRAMSAPIVLLLVKLVAGAVNGF